MPKSVQKLDISKLISRSLELIRVSSNNAINLKVNTQDLIIYGDEDQLNRVFINLIKNSEEALVEISTKDPSSRNY